MQSIRRIHMGECNQSEESKGGEVQSIRKIKREEEIKLWVLDSPNNQSVSTRPTKQQKCEHSTHQTNKLRAPTKQTKYEQLTHQTNQNCEHPPNKQNVSNWPTKQTNKPIVSTILLTQNQKNWTKQSQPTKQTNKPIVNIILTHPTTKKIKPNETKSNWTKLNQDILKNQDEPRQAESKQPETNNQLTRQKHKNKKK